MDQSFSRSEKNSMDGNVFYRPHPSMLFDRSETEEVSEVRTSIMATNAADVSPQYVLSYIQSVMFACLLEDAIMQIRILDECNNELRIFKTMTDMADLLSLKYQIEQTPSNEDELVSGKHNDLENIQYKLDKLAGDRIFCADLLMATYMELSLDNCFSSIVNSNMETTNKENYRFYLLTEETKNKLTRREAMRQLRQQRIHARTVIYDTDIIIDQLKSQIELAVRDSITHRALHRESQQTQNALRIYLGKHSVGRSAARWTDDFKKLAGSGWMQTAQDRHDSLFWDAALRAEMRSRYITNWQSSRAEQHDQMISNTEEGPSKSIKYYHRRSEQEQRIHSEVELLVNIFINETLTSVESWMNKYDTDMEKIDLKIQITRTNFQEQTEKRKELEKTILLHEKKMKDWITFKEERRKAREYVEKMNKSAIIVQAWWRGLLVRCQLGPYKPKHHAKAKKKK